MKLSPPKRGTWLLSLLLAVTAVLSQTFVEMPALSPYAFWLLAVAFVLLALGTLLPGI